MSANLVVDIGNTCQSESSILPQVMQPSSGLVMGRSVDMLYANTQCQVLVNHATTQSGTLRVAIQESDTDVSGNFTPVLASGNPWSSGGVLTVNSGGIGILSGKQTFAAFERGGRFVRAIALSGGLFDAVTGVGFVSQRKTTGSGGGSTQSPQV